jgi:replicative DNA helicase
MEKVIMSKVFKSLKEQVKRGMEGLNTGLPTRLTRLDSFTTGIQQGNYWLIGAETSVGKTVFARDQFIYEPYQYWLANKDKFSINFLDFSLEMTAEQNLASLVSKDIYRDYGKVVSKEVLLSKGRDIDGNARLLHEDIFEIFESYEEKYEEFEKHMTIIDTDVTPTLYHLILMKYAKMHGKFENNDAKYIGQAGAYTPNDPSLYTMILFDTINLGEPEENQVVKQAIDRLSRISVWFRNVCKFTFVIIQQFNSEISSTDRFKTNIKTPLLRDFEDSKRPTKDADIVLGLFDPSRHEMDTVLGYNCELMKNWFRSAHLMKNRNGENNKAVGMQFKGATGMFSELPRASMFRDDPTLYEKYMKY